MDVKMKAVMAIFGFCIVTQCISISNHELDVWTRWSFILGDTHDLTKLRIVFQHRN